MLSDRIKKFGVKARQEEKKLLEEAVSPIGETDRNNNDSGRISDGPDKDSLSSTAAVKKIMADVRERSSSAQIAIIDTYVEKKLSEIDRKQAEREKKAILRDEAESDTDAVIPENGSGGDSVGDSGVPLLLRYSAALQNMRSAADEEKRKSERSTNSSQEAKISSESDENEDDIVKQEIKSPDDRSLNNNSVFDADITNVLSGENSSDVSKNTDDWAQSDVSAGDVPDAGGGEAENDTGSDQSVLFDLQWSGRKNGSVNADNETENDTEIDKSGKSDKKAKRMIPAKSCVYAPFLVAVTELLAVASSRISISSLERRDNIYIALVVIQLLVYIIPGIFYCKLRHKNDVSTLRLSVAKPDRLYFAVVAALTLFAVSAAFKLLYIQLGIYKSDFAAYASYINISTFSSASDILYMIITFVFIPAVSKEFIFRSVIFGEYMNDGFGYVAPAVISSVMYAMIYFRIAAFPKYFIIGMILSLTSLIADSVIISMVAGTVYGLLDVFSESYIANLMRSDYKLLLVFVTVAMLLLFITLFFAEAERLFFNKGTAGDPSPTLKIRKEKLSVFLRSAFCRPSFLVCAVLFLLGVIVNAV